MVGPEVTEFSVILNFTNHDILILKISYKVTTMTFLARTMTFYKTMQKIKNYTYNFFLFFYLAGASEMVEITTPRPIKFKINFMRDLWCFYNNQKRPWK